MTRLTRLCRTVGVGLAVTTATLAMTQVANAEPPPPTVPANLMPPTGNKVFLVAHVSTGVQKYQCTVTGTSGVWKFVAPEADLVGNNDKNVIVKHSVGPTWTATDGSTAKGSNPVPANGTDTNIPWLLLQATGSPGPNGDRLANTTYIQRVNTAGGVAPKDVCDASNSGTVKGVPYNADYYFWKATGPGAP